LPEYDSRRLNQVAGHLLPTDPDRDVTEVDLGLGAGAMRLGDERLDRSPAGLHPDLGPSLGDIAPHDAIRHRRVMLVDEPVEDPLDGVTLLARRVQIGAQHRIDHPA
jgi:hypothetical protein